MSLPERRRNAERAERLLQLERDAWRIRTQPLRARIALHREAVTLGGGFAGGLFAGLLPIGSLARVSRFVANMIALAMRGARGGA